MSNLASVLKDEIRRLARKEARVEIKALKSSSTQYRRDIALNSTSSGWALKSPVPMRLASSSGLPGASARAW